MALTVLTPALVTDLVTLAQVKARYGYPDAEDSLVGDYIDEISSAIRQHFGRELARQRYQETLAGRGRKRLRLACNPIDPDSVTVTVDGTAETDFEVEEWESGTIYLAGGWPDSEERDVAVTYKGGFLMPAATTAAGVVTGWSATQAYAAGAWVRSVATAAALRFECTTAGTSAGTEPTWPTTAGTTVTDGTAVWTARQAVELPPVLRSLAAMAVRDLYSGAQRPAGLLSSQADGYMESFSVTGSSTGSLSPELLSALAPLRAEYGR